MNLEINTTFGKGSFREHFHQVITLTQDPGSENNVVNIYPEIELQEIEGFGGAITDSAAYVYSLMNQEQKRELLETYFSPKRMNYKMLRVHVDSCDFSLDMYEAMSDSSDVEMTTFSMERTEKYILPMLEDIRDYMGNAPSLMLSPWSPPAFMKTNGKRNFGGKLKAEYREMWAKYLCRYIKEFRDRGFKVERMSLQNEPKAVQTWDSCVYTVQEEKIFLRDFMYPTMQKYGMDDIEVFLWDHNKERIYEWMRDSIDEETDHMIAGAAFHWYSGDHFDALELCRRQFPDKKLILSESCIEFSKFDGDEDCENALRLSHEIIGDLNHGMCAFYDWNVLLNEKGGPNHVGNYCLAPFMFDREEKKLTRQVIAQHIEHFSGNLVEGSRILAVTKFSEEIDAAACIQPSGCIVVFLVNKSKDLLPVTIRIDGKIAELMLLPKSISSGIIRSSL